MPSPVCAAGWPLAGGELKRFLPPPPWRLRLSANCLSPLPMATLLASRQTYRRGKHMQMGQVWRAIGAAIFMAAGTGGLLSAPAQGQAQGHPQDQSQNGAGPSAEKCQGLLGLGGTVL